MTTRISCGEPREKVDTIADTARQAVTVEQGQKAVNFLFLAVVGHSGAQQQVAREPAELLAQVG